MLFMKIIEDIAQRKRRNMSRVAYNYLFLILIESCFVLVDHYLLSSWASAELVGFFI